MDSVGCAWPLLADTPATTPALALRNGLRHEEHLPQRCNPSAAESECRPEMKPAEARQGSWGVIARQHRATAMAGRHDASPAAPRVGIAATDCLARMCVCARTVRSASPLSGQVRALGGDGRALGVPSLGAGPSWPDLPYPGTAGDRTWPQRTDGADSATARPLCPPAFGRLCPEVADRRGTGAADDVKLARFFIERIDCGLALAASAIEGRRRSPGARAARNRSRFALRCPVARRLSPVPRSSLHPWSPTTPRLVG